LFIIETIASCAATKDIVGNEDKLGQHNQNENIEQEVNIHPTRLGQPISTMFRKSKVGYQSP